MARQHVEMQARRGGAVIPRGLLTRGHAVWVRDVLTVRRVAIKISVTVVVALFVLLRWDAGAAFFLALLTASVTGLVDRRVSVSLGLFSLASCPLLSVADREAWLQRSSLVNYYAASAGLYDAKVAADTVVVWAYYFLCIGVIAHIMSYVIVRKRRGREK